MTIPSTILKADGLCKHFKAGNETIEVIKDLSLEINSGERIAICGSSGSGKSTLLNLLGALDSFDSGSLSILNQNVASLSENQRAQLRNQQLGFVYQFHHLLPEFSALENVAMPLLINRTARATAFKAATDLLDKIGLAQRLKHRPSQLSGGECQRVAIARALVTDPCCVLMDEPTGNLDDVNSASILQLINDLNQQLSTAFVIVTHDLSLAKQLDRLLQLQQGKLIPIS